MTSPSDNPYLPPTAALAEPAGPTEYQPVATWSPRGRIGRLRLMAHYLGMSILLGVFSTLFSALMGSAGYYLGIATNLVLVVFLILKFIQRSHDMDWSAWYTLLALIPLVGLAWVIKPGSPGTNRFGAPPPPNGVMVIIGGLAMPALVLLGVVAAIAVPWFLRPQ